MSEIFTKIERLGLIVYLHYNRDVRKLTSYGDVVYHSKKLRYAVVYMEQEQVGQAIQSLQGEKFVKEVVPSYIKDLNQNFVGILYRDEKENVLL